VVQARAPGTRYKAKVSRAVVNVKKFLRNELFDNFLD